MSKLIYVGSMAGLVEGGSDKAGDANSPFDYVLECRCGTILGPLGRFSPNADGHRSAYCPTCLHATIIREDGQIAAVVPVPLTHVGHHLRTG